MLEKSISQMLEDLKNDELDHENLYYIRGDGGIEFWYRGRLHCDTGPAIIHKDGRKEYYIHGVFYSEKEFLNEYLNKNLSMQHSDLPKLKI